MNVVKVDLKKADIKIIKKAADLMAHGGMIIYPTDTAYGIGVNAFDLKAIKTLYDVKLRNYDKPTHVIVRDWEMLKLISFPTQNAKKVYKKLMPGPITIILQKKSTVPDFLAAYGKTIGIRIPNNDVTKMISMFSDFPYTTPSANSSGGKTPYSIEEVRESLDINKFDLVIDAGKLEKNPPSTIVDLSKNTPRLIREGSIKKEKIEKIIGRFN